VHLDVTLTVIQNGLVRFVPKWTWRRSLGLLPVISEHGPFDGIYDVATAHDRRAGCRYLSAPCDFRRAVIDRVKSTMAAG
jgi:hypothetical protein